MLIGISAAVLVGGKSNGCDEKGAGVGVGVASVRESALALASAWELASVLAWVLASRLELKSRLQLPSRSLSGRPSKLESQWELGSRSTLVSRWRSGGGGGSRGRGRGWDWGRSRSRSRSRRGR